MGKLKFFPASPSQDLFQYYTYVFDMDVHSGSSVTLLDDHGGKVTLKGKGFVFNSEMDIIAGKVTSVTIGDENGAVFAQFTGTFKATSIHQVGSGIDFVSILFAMHAKDDLITGSKDADVLYGLGGSDKINGRGGDDLIYADTRGDRLTGGKGSDTFILAPEAADVIITDFDAVGGGVNQDYLDANSTNYTMKQKGDDLILTFDDETKVTLLGVSKNDFDVGDLVI